MDTTGDPWNGRTLEWATTSPAPFYNFALIPKVEGRDAFWTIKQEAGSKESVKYEDIELPKNTPMAIYVSAFIFLFGFAMVWHMILLAIVSLIGAITCAVIRVFDEHTEYVVSAEEVERLERESRHR